MAKKQQSNSKKQSRNKQSVGSLLVGLFCLFLLLGSLFLAERAGLVDVDWEGLLSGQSSNKIISEAPAAPMATTPVAAALIQGEWYRLYFTTPKYPDESATRAETIVDGLVEAMNSAQRSLDIAIYELDIEPIGEAILAARDRGVAVRLVTDSDSLEEDETLKRLKKAKVPIVPDERSPIMHNKFVVVDDKAVWTGSWNFTINDTYRNNNNAIYIQSPELAQNYTTEFEEMFDQKSFGPTSPANTPHPKIKIGDTLIETCFAPEDHCANQLITLIGQTQKDIRFMAFSFTHAGIGQAVSTQAKAGVTTQGVFETRGSETKSSQLAQLKRRKLDVWQDGNPYTLHHKVFILDDQTIIFGSFNFSDNADTANDENMLVIHNAAIAAQFLAEFNRVYDQAKNTTER